MNGDETEKWLLFIMGWPAFLRMSWLAENLSKKEVAVAIKPDLHEMVSFIHGLPDSFLRWLRWTRQRCFSGNTSTGSGGKSAADHSVAFIK
jgi:hypothetical protein